MFKKILIAEDVDMTALGLEDFFRKFPDTKIIHSRYCDDALLKIKKSLLEKQPYDLLITDLSFVPDHRDTTLENGESLAAAVRALQPDIKILVYSIEDKIHKIRSLFEQTGVNGFVWKGRESISELHKALAQLLDGGTYLSPRFNHILNPLSVLQVSLYDVRIIELLADGCPQSEIGDILKSEGLSGSASTIEKTINRLKSSFKARNSLHLVSIAKDLRII